MSLKATCGSTCLLDWLIIRLFSKVIWSMAWPKGSGANASQTVPGEWSSSCWKSLRSSGHWICSWSELKYLTAKICPYCLLKSIITSSIPKKIDKKSENSTEILRKRRICSQWWKYTMRPKLVKHVTQPSFLYLYLQVPRSAKNKRKSSKSKSKSKDTKREKEKKKNRKRKKRYPDHSINHGRTVYCICETIQNQKQKPRLQKMYRMP